MQALRGPLGSMQTELEELRSELRAALAPLADVHRTLQSIERSLGGLREELRSTQQRPAGAGDERSPTVPPSLRSERPRGSRAP